MAAPAAILTVLVNANTAKATSSLKKVDHQVGATSKGFGRLAKSALAVGAALGGIAEAKKAVETTESLAKSTMTLGRNFGLSAEQASTWGAVLKANNIDTRSTQMAFTTLSKQIEAAGKGSKPAIQAFKDLGLSQKDLKGQNFGQTLDEVTAALTKMQGGSKRAADAQILMGRGAKTLAPLFRGDGLGFQQQAKWAQQYGATLDGHAIRSSKELAIASEKLKFAQMGLQIQFTEKIIPALLKVAGVIMRVISFFEKHKTVTKALVDVLALATAAWAGYRAAALLSAAATAVATGGISLIIPALAAFAAGIALLYDKSAAFRRGVEVWWGIIKNVIVGTVHVILTVVDKFLGGLQAIFEAASHLPVVGKRFGKIADAIGNARDKVRGLRDDVDKLNDKKISVTVQVNALLEEFQAGTIPSLVKGKIPSVVTNGKTVQHKALGGMLVGGSGSGDKVPLQAMVEPGEAVYVLNRNATSALDFLDSMNSAVPRFATGGRLSLAHPGAQIRSAVTMMGKSASASYLKLHPAAPTGGGSGAALAQQFAGSKFKSIQALGHRMMLAFGYPESEWGPYNTLEMHEAGWNPLARNKLSGAFGIPQALPPTKMPLAAQRGDPVSQIAWMLSYIKGRYGTPSRAWAQYYAHPGGVGYYKRGGLVGRGWRRLAKGGAPRPDPSHGRTPTIRKPTKYTGKLLDQSDQIQAVQDYLDALAAAGAISDAAATAQKVSALQSVLARPKQYGLTKMETLQFQADLRNLQAPPDTGAGADTQDPNQALIDALQADTDARQAQTDALNALHDEAKRANDFNQSISQTQYGALKSELAQIVNGNIGGKVGLGFAMPSSPGKVSSL